MIKSIVRHSGGCRNPVMPGNTIYKQTINALIKNNKPCVIRPLDALWFLYTWIPVFTGMTSICLIGVELQLQTT